MATYVAPVPQVAAHRVEREAKGWTSWITTTDHKRIGIMYIVTTFVFFLLGGVEALMMRLQLGSPNNALVTPTTYNQLFTMHGTTMIFLFVVPMMAGLANYFVPLMIGARDMAFPRLNALSYWLLLAGGLVFYSSIFWNPPEAGWVSFMPLANSTFSPGGGEDAWIYLIHLTGISSILGAINFYATIANMRAKGMSWGRLPLFIWTILVYSVLIVFAMPVIAAAVTLLLTERHFGTHFFDATEGGSPVLWQHLFWFFGHPEVYIAILPGMGVTSQLLSVFARKPIFGYRAMVYAILSIGFLGFVVWGHHMFMSGMSPYSAMAFSVLTMTIGVPSAIKTFNWIGTLWGGQIRFTTAMLFALGFVSLFVTGGISGIFLGQPALDLYFHDTYFVVGHFHMIMGVAAIFGMFAGTFYWFPKMFGRMMNES
ncbi:MAG: ctaD, partial [Solirubrobacterales bacterium]|nr:ctaD [Solirubrobacterales bacterium]